MTEMKGIEGETKNSLEGRSSRIIVAKEKISELQDEMLPLGNKRRWKKSEKKGKVHLRNDEFKTHEFIRDELKNHWSL